MVEQHVPLVDAGLPIGVHGGFTTRAGGSGRAPYDGLNLGDHVGDDPDVVAVHRDALRRTVTRFANERKAEIQFGSR